MLDVYQAKATCGNCGRNVMFGVFASRRGQTDATAGSVSLFAALASSRKKCCIRRVKNALAMQKPRGQVALMLDAMETIADSTKYIRKWQVNRSRFHSKQQKSVLKYDVTPNSR